MSDFLTRPTQKLVIFVSLAQKRALEGIRRLASTLLDASKRVEERVIDFLEEMRLILWALLKLGLILIGGSAPFLFFYSRSKNKLFLAGPFLWILLVLVLIYTTRLSPQSEASIVESAANMSKTWRFVMRYTLRFMGLGAVVLFIWGLWPRNELPKSNSLSLPYKPAAEADSPTQVKHLEPAVSEITDELAAPSAPKAGVDGRWTGEWNGPEGDRFTFNMDLQQSKEASVSGKIDWTLRSSRSYQYLIGRSGIEFVCGSFEPGLRSVKLQGYEKQDPYGVIGLDVYELTLSADTQELSGRTNHHGTWGGNFFGRRATPP